MKLGVIGLGHVGLVTAACLAEISHEVFATDKAADRMAALRRGDVPIYEQRLPGLLTRHGGRNLHFRDSFAAVIHEVEAVFICVGTPGNAEGETDLSSVEEVVRNIARHIGSRLLIVEKSTVPIRTCEIIRRTMISSGAHRDFFSIASNPEFLHEGTAVADFLCPDRIVLGTDDEFGRRLLTRVYLPLTSGAYYQRASRVAGLSAKRPHVIQTSTKSAELIKHACNAFLAMKISFVNAVANIAEGSGAEIDEVCEGMASDPRIGAQFLQAGIGYGGSCFPKDVRAFKVLAEKAGYPFGLLAEVTTINMDQPIRFMGKLRRALGTLQGKRIAALGLSFKGGTDDIRESPAVALVRLMADEGAHVVAYDPAAMDAARIALSSADVDFAADPYETMMHAHALVILTDWPQFSRLDLKYARELMQTPIAIDGRNLYSPAQMQAAGFYYASVGRRTVRTEIEAIDTDGTVQPIVDEDRRTGLDGLLKAAG